MIFSTFTKSDGGIAELIARVASGMLIISIIGAGVALLGQIFLARLLGAEEYGWYVLILAWVQILIVPAVCGFDTAVLKFTSTAVAERDWGQLRGLLTFSFSTVLGISTVMVLCAAAVLAFYDLGLSDDRRHAMFVALALVPIMAVTPLAGESLRGLKKMLLASGITKILRPSMLLAIAFVMSRQLTADMTATEVLIANTIAAIIALAAICAMLWKLLPSPVFHSQAHYEKRLWIKVALPMVFMSAMYIILAKIDIIMLGKFASPRDAGIYAATSRLTEIVGFGLAAVNSIAAPMLAEHFANRDFAKLQLTLSWSARLAAGFTVIASVVLWLGGDIILSWFGAEFVVGYSALLILLIGAIASSFAGPVGYMLTMAGEQILAAFIIFGTAILNIVMNLILIPKYGIIGAAIATSISTVVSNLIMFVVVRAKWQLNASALGRV
jgi:O-antigen/teichoic acid export membrane protein